MDPTTGLQNNRARWYSFTIGWIGEDPAQADINTYRYAGNNPANFTDPSGLDSVGLGTQLGYDANDWLGQHHVFDDHMGAIGQIFQGLGYPTVTGAPGSTAAYDQTRDIGIQVRDGLVDVYKQRARVAAAAAGIADAGEIEALENEAAAEARKLTPVPPERFDLMKFAGGLAVGAGAGAVEFFQGLGGLISNPMGVFQGIAQLVQVVTNGSMQDAAKALFPDLYKLVTEWDTLSSYDKGFYAGKIIGQYGAQAATGAIAARLTHQVGLAAQTIRPISLQRTQGCGI